MNDTLGRFLVQRQLSEEEESKLPAKEKQGPQSLGMPARTVVFLETT